MNGFHNRSLSPFKKLLAIPAVTGKTSTHMGHLFSSQYRKLRTKVQTSLCTLFVSLTQDNSECKGGEMLIFVTCNCISGSQRVIKARILDNLPAVMLVLLGSCLN